MTHIIMNTIGYHKQFNNDKISFNTYICMDEEKQNLEVEKLTSDSKRQFRETF